MRIVSLAPSNTEILYNIGAGDEVVATTSLCDHPEDAREKPSIGGWTDPRIERLKHFEPDLLMASDDLQDDAVEEIRSKDFKVLQVKPHSLEEVFGSIAEIGAAIGRKEEAERLVTEMKEKLDELHLEGSPRIYCEEWMDPPMVSGNWIPGLVERIGGDYFAEGGRSRKFDLEKLKRFDPEHIFLNVCGAGENLDAEEVTKRDEWQEISAVENGEVYVIDDSFLNRPGPRLVEGAEKIVEKIEG